MRSATALGRGVGWLGRFVLVGVPAVLAGATRGFAQAPPTTPASPAPGGSAIPNPAPVAPPGATLMTEILGWLKYGALWASVAALLIGAIAIGVGHFGSNYGASSAGRKWLLGGIACAALAALAWTFASTVYNSTS